MKQHYQTCTQWLLENQDTASPFKLRMAQLFMTYFPGQLTCGEFEEFVIDYSEGNLAGAARRKFDFHMTACPKCRTHFNAYVRAVALGKKVCVADDDPAPGDVPEELIEAILAARRED